MKRYLPFILVVLFIITAGLLYKIDRSFKRSTPPIQPKSPAASQASSRNGQIPRLNPFPETITILPIASSSDSLHSADTTPEDDLSLIHSMLRELRRALGENPVGLNDEITAALTGSNKKGAACLAKDHPAISNEGELLDRWQTPYRFHAYSGKLMEIRSAGPDQKFFSSDDIMLRE